MDTVSQEKRSEIMAAVKSENTRPEIRVRSKLHRMGYRFRLHGKELDGKPDIVLKKLKTAIFVHGCFWHRHDCKKATMPSSNFEYWEAKFKRNIERFSKIRASLQKEGWRVLVVWECQTEKEKDLEEWIEKNL